jgi:hypothetical protein
MAPRRQLTIVATDHTSMGHELLQIHIRQFPGLSTTLGQPPAQTRHQQQQPGHPTSRVTPAKQLPPEPGGIGRQRPGHLHT